MLLGKKIIGKKLETPIADFGMYRNQHKNRSYAFLKGLIDAGLKLKCSKDVFPEEGKITGKNLKKDFSKNFDEIKNKISKK